MQQVEFISKNHNMKELTIVMIMTSDYSYDQRMQRIVATLSELAAIQVWHRGKSNSLGNEKNRFVTIDPTFNKGGLFYFGFNIIVFFKLLFAKTDIIYCVDTDSLLAGGLVARIRRKILIYDSHEWFTEVPELKGRNLVKGIWSAIEKIFIPRADLLITVNDSLAKIFSEKWQKPFYSIRNLPFTKAISLGAADDKMLLYQGAVNKGRGLECLILAMEYLPDYKCIIVGNGDIKQNLENMSRTFPWCNRIEFISKILPDQLDALTVKARYGLNLLDDSSLSYHYSLANKFFDYLQAGIPSINMDLPEYRKWVQEDGIGLLLPTLNARELAELILKNDKGDIYQKMKDNCLKNRNKYVWEVEAPKLLKLFEGLHK